MPLLSSANKDSHIIGLPGYSTLSAVPCSLWSNHPQGCQTLNVTPRYTTRILGLLFWLCGRPDLCSELLLGVGMGMHIVISAGHSLAYT
jgi:hypothetical protein